MKRVSVGNDKGMGLTWALGNVNLTLRHSLFKNTFRREAAHESLVDLDMRWFHIHNAREFGTVHIDIELVK